MIQRQLKLRLNTRQEDQLNTWLFQLTGVWNWAIRKIELDANDGIYHSPQGFKNLLAGHAKKLGIPSHTLQGMLGMAHAAWQACYKKLARKPKFKGQRNKLMSIPFPDPFKAPDGTRLRLPGIGYVRFHKQALPEGSLKCGRLIKRSSGWYLCLFIDRQPNTVPHVGEDAIGIDPGFTMLLTLSTGEKIAHPHELRQVETRLAQAQRGKRKHLVARLHERLANQRKDRNHKLSRRLVAEHQAIVWSKDNNLARFFGKSVASAGHAQLRDMLAYKCTASGRQFLEVASKNSTKTCSACGSLSGPTGYAGLKVRQWQCAECGSAHDRDVNAAINTLHAGVGITLEHRRETVPGIPWHGSGEVQERLYIMTQTVIEPRLSQLGRHA
jgi:putative transposase